MNRLDYSIGADWHIARDVIGAVLEHLVPSQPPIVAHRVAVFAASARDNGLKPLQRRIGRGTLSARLDVELDAKAEGTLAYPIWDFYLTNAICRASPTMRRCSEELLHGQAYAEAAE